MLSVHKNYIGISRDHSGSMQNLINPAIKDYNQTIASVKKSAIRGGIDTIVTVANCGVGSGSVELEVINSSISALRPMTEYRAEGQTPLFESVGTLIDTLKKAPDSKHDGVSFLVMAITDGAENNSSSYWRNNLAREIKKLQETDKWTFVFRVPRGYAGNLTKIGIPAGNIQEWDQTEEGFRRATVETDKAFSQYYDGLSKGKRASTSFYTDLSSVDIKKVQKTLVDISSEVDLWICKDDADGKEIRMFCQKRLQNGEMYKKGAAFYLLVKREEIQAQKLLCIREKKTGKVYSGDAARNIIGLPHGITVKVSPGDHGNYDIFVQSTSVNRKLKAGNTVLYWRNLPV